MAPFFNQDQAMKELLMIFVRNPERGKVKTRLAKDIGDDRALRVYEKLLEKTLLETQHGGYHKWLFYSEKVTAKDLWGAEYVKKVQDPRPDLGMKMLKAFEEGFRAGYQRICIIGSDCYELTQKDTEEAFLALRGHDFVIGPANDGGYYLLGMNVLNQSVFSNKEWSSDTVFHSTIADLKAQKTTYLALRELTDIDTIEDLKKFPELMNC